MKGHNIARAHHDIRATADVAQTFNASEELYARNVMTSTLPNVESPYPVDLTVLIHASVQFAAQQRIR